MEESESIKLAIIGGGRGCLEMIQLLHGLSCARILAVVDPNAQAVGMQEARRLGITTHADTTPLHLLKLDYIIEATGVPAVLEQTKVEFANKAEIITAAISRFLFNAASERQHRAIGEIREIQKQIQESARQIGQVMQSNLNLVRELQIVSINASVEAARSGEAGRGFAVVASRIRELAEVYRRNSEEIHSINESIMEIAHSVDESLQNLG